MVVLVLHLQYLAQALLMLEVVAVEAMVVELLVLVEAEAVAQEVE